MDARTCESERTHKNCPLFTGGNSVWLGEETFTSATSRGSVETSLTVIVRAS